MCDPISIGMGLNIFGGISSAANQYASGRAEQAYYEFEAAGYEETARNIEFQRDRDIKRFKEDVRQFSESQKAAMAANGIDIDSVTAEDIMSDTAAQAKLDELTIEYNANLQAWQARNQARMSRMAGRNAARAGETNAFNTLLGTAGQVADYWQRWKSTSQEQGKKYGGSRPGNYGIEGRGMAQ